MLTKGMGDKMREWINAYEIIIKLMEQNQVSIETINYIKRDGREKLLYKKLFAECII